jgi:hypothetical protein
MKSARKQGRSPDEGSAMALLAQARPPRLDPHALARNWPTAGQIIEAAEQGDSDPAYDGSTIGCAHLLGAHRHKLVGAIASAVVTAIVIVVVLAAVGSIAHGPHGKIRSAPPRPVGAGNQPMVFHSLRLDASWHGRLAYAVRDGVVYLTGSARSSAGADSAITALPPGPRPRGRIDLVVSFGRDGDGFIEVTPNGLIRAFRPRRIALINSISLAGVSFPVGSG